MTKRFRIYGADGHRQRQAFFASFEIDTNGFHIQVLNSDKTGTEMYSEVVITGDNAEAIEAELNGQITDGIFENCRVHRVEEVEA